MQLSEFKYSLGLHPAFGFSVCPRLLHTTLSSPLHSSPSSPKHLLSCTSLDGSYQLSVMTFRPSPVFPRLHMRLTIIFLQAQIAQIFPGAAQTLTDVISNLSYPSASLLVAFLLSFCPSSLADIFFWKVLKSSRICQALPSHPTHIHSHLDSLMKSQHDFVRHARVKTCEMHFLAAFLVISEECNG